MEQLVGGGFAALLDRWTIALIVEGEMPGVTANASLKLSTGPRLTTVFLTFSVCLRKGEGGYCCAHGWS